MATINTKPDFINQSLDDLKARMSLPSDSALAEHLEVSKQMLSQVRAGTARAPARMITKLLDRAGYAITRDALLSLLPRRTAATVRAYDNKRRSRRTKAIGDPKFDLLRAELDKALEHHSSEDLAEAIDEYLRRNQ